MPEIPKPRKKKNFFGPSLTPLVEAADSRKPDVMSTLVADAMSQEALASPNNAREAAASPTAAAAAPVTNAAGAGTSSQATADKGKGKTKNEVLCCVPFVLVGNHGNFSYIHYHLILLETAF